MSVKELLRGLLLVVAWIWGAMFIGIVLMEAVNGNAFGLFLAIAFGGPAWYYLIARWRHAHVRAQHAQTAARAEAEHQEWMSQ